MLTIPEMKSLAVAAIESHSDEIIAISKHILENPETGFTEQKTSKFVQEKFKALGIPFQDNLAITGIKGFVDGGAGPGPSVAVIGELDSLRVIDHPYHDDVTGAAHACGHHCQIGSMIGTLIGVMVPEVLENLSGRIIPIAVPAEEFIEVERRKRLRDEGKIEFMGGKQEFIKLGVFDDVDMAMICHTATDEGKFSLGLGGTSTANVLKLVEYYGRGAHAGAAPHKGINALNAAMIALSGINANRETFRDQDTVRVNGILTSGGDAVNVIPGNVTLEYRVRSGHLDALANNSKKVDRSFKAGALAVGARVSITNIAGYLPMRNNKDLQQLFGNNADEVVGKDNVLVRPDNYNDGGSTDMGDLAHIMPLIHPFCGGADGTPHGNDYVIGDYDKAVIKPAKTMAMTIIDLLAERGQKAIGIKENDPTPMTKSEYLKLQRERNGVVEFDGSED